MPFLTTSGEYRIARLRLEAETVILLPDAHYTGISTIVSVAGQTVALTTSPGQLVLEEK